MIKQIMLATMLTGTIGTTPIKPPHYNAIYENSIFSNWTLEEGGAGYNYSEWKEETHITNREEFDILTSEAYIYTSPTMKINDGINTSYYANYYLKTKANADYTVNNLSINMYFDTYMKSLNYTIPLKLNIMIIYRSINNENPNLLHNWFELGLNYAELENNYINNNTVIRDGQSRQYDFTKNETIYNSKANMDIEIYPNNEYIITLLPVDITNPNTVYIFNNLDGEAWSKPFSGATIPQLKYNYYLKAVATNEYIDIPEMMFTVLTMPFAFISQAFNLTLFPGTPYAVDISKLLLALIGVMVFIFIMKTIIKLKDGGND